MTAEPGDIAVPKHGRGHVVQDLHRDFGSVFEFEIVADEVADMVQYDEARPDLVVLNLNRHGLGGAEPPNGDGTEGSETVELSRQRGIYCLPETEQQDHFLVATEGSG